MRNIMRASDCVILPSVSENLSIAIIEAMMAATPAIVTRVGGMPELIQDGVTGRIVPARSPAALREAILWMLANRERARRLGEQARQQALARFTRSRMMQEYVQLFAKMCGRSTGATNRSSTPEFVPSNSYRSR